MKNYFSFRGQASHAQLDFKKKIEKIRESGKLCVYLQIGGI